MSDYIEVELKYGLNWVVYKNTNDEVKPDTQLFLKNDDDNEHTPIGTLAEVRNKTPAGSSTEVMNKNGKQIATMDSMTGALLDNTTLYAKNPNTPTNKGGKRKTKKYFRKRKTDKRKSKRKKKGKGKGKTRKFR
jgi:hypothetical protein